MTAFRTRTIHFILAGALAALPAVATPITYSISQMAVSGTIGATPFSNELVTFTQVTDTGDLTNPCGGFAYPCAPQQTGNSVTIATVGTFTLTGESYFFDNLSGQFGIAFEPFGVYLAADAVLFSTYDMTTAFGPTAYTFYSGSAVSGVATSGGALSISWNTDQQTTAQACLGGGCSTSSTPEPGSLGLALVGAIPLAAGLLRRRRH
jgi:MYXO-CTERM domain-containing protein